MKYFTNLFTGSWAKGLQQRPLLCVAGAAATAVGVYYYSKRERNEEERAIPAQFTRALESIEKFTVKERVRKLGDLLLESYAECEEKNKECERERETKSVLQSQNDEMKGILSELENRLNFNPAENVEKYKQMMEFNTELQKEHSELIYNMQNLSNTLEKMEEKVHVADKMCEGMRQDYETECRIHCILKVQYNELKGQNKELLKDTLNEFLAMSKRYEQMMEINAQMEKEQLDYVQELSGTVEQLEEKIHEAERTCEKIKQEHESARGAYSALKLQHEETLKQGDELLKECEREREAHSALRSQYDQMNKSSDTKKSLMVTLNKSLAMSKQYEQMMEINAQMEKKQLDYVQELRGTVKQLEEKIHEAERMCEEIKQEHERAQKAYSALKSQHEETLNRVIR